MEVFLFAFWLGGDSFWGMILFGDCIFAREFGFCLGFWCLFEKCICVVDESIGGRWKRVFQSLGNVQWDRRNRECEFSSHGLIVEAHRCNWSCFRKRVFISRVLLYAVRSRPGYSREALLIWKEVGFCAFWAQVNTCFVVFWGNVSYFIGGLGFGGLVGDLRVVLYLCEPLFWYGHTKRCGYKLWSAASFCDVRRSERIEGSVAMSVSLILLLDWGKVEIPSIILWLKIITNWLVFEEWRV